MTQVHRYIDSGGLWTVDLGNAAVRLGTIALGESAQNGDSASSTVPIDDPSATVGHSSDAITGHKFYAMDELAAASGSQRAYMGLVTARDYARTTDSLNTGAARRIDATVYDLNNLLQLRDIISTDTTGNRPRESAGTRLRWLLASGYMSSVADHGLVVYPSHYLDKNDYRGQKPQNVLEDIVMPVAWNFFVYWSEADGTPGLFLDNSNVSTAYTSTLRLSNVLADKDSDANIGTGATGTYMATGTLTRDPANVYSGVSVTYAKGTTYQTSSTIAAAYISRDGVAPNGNVKTRTAALKIGKTFLAEAATESDLIAATVQVPASAVNLIRAGHRISAKWSHLPGYTSFTWFRVIKRIVRQDEANDRYYLDLSLVPMTATGGACSTEINQAHGTVVGHVEATSGVTWAHATWSCWPYSLPGTCDTAVSTIPINSPTKANDGDPTTYSWIDQTSLRTDGTATAYWESDLDASYTLCSTRGTTAVGSVSWQSMAPDIIEYWTGAAWVAAPGAFTYTAASPTPQYWIYTFSDTITTTKLRIGYTQVGVSIIAGLWSFLAGGRRVYDWLIYT